MAALVEGETVASFGYRSPGPADKVFKDECVYCFHTPFFPDGLFVSMNTFIGVCSRHLEDYAKETGDRIFLHLSSQKVVIDEPAEPENKITKLAIGISGGFCNEKTKIEEHHEVVVFPDLKKGIDVTPEELGPQLYEACLYVISNQGADRQEQLESAGWDGSAKIISKHSDLEQHNNGKVIPPTGWMCEEEGCGLTENLWLNLTDGAIRCGRSQYVSEGVVSKGNNHMRQYFDLTGYPLVVKLGTIDKDGLQADVYSYDEDDSVIDTNLIAHVTHFGLDPATLEKTEKSTLELELDINQKWEWAKCSEDGAELESVFGPGYTGIINIGSSCYINSVVQTLIMIPDFVRRFGPEGSPEIFKSKSTLESFSDVYCQTAKLFTALLSGDYSVKGSEYNIIKPTHFKRLIGRGHPEFSSARQQDAEEYIRYLLDKLTTTRNPDWQDPVEAVRFQMEHRLMDNASQRVRYSYQEDVLLRVNVPQDQLVNLDSGRFFIDLETCLQVAFADDHRADYVSPVTGERAGAVSTIRFKTFPDFLFLQIQKFTFTPEMAVKKLDLEIDMPDELDLSRLRASGPQPEEQFLPEEDAAPPQPQPPPFSDAVVAALEGMGFSRNASIKASVATENAGVEVATEWLMTHMDDPDLNKPLQQPQATGGPSEEAVGQLVGFGFTENQAKYALGRNNNDINAAADWLFQHADEVPTEAHPAAKTPPPAAFRDGSSKYRLVGFISHMGSSPHSGHYVVHLLRDGRWILYNDEKVAASQSPPRRLAYIYLYERV